MARKKLMQTFIARGDAGAVSRRISHPSVCRMFDVGYHEDDDEEAVPFISNDRLVLVVQATGRAHFGDSQNDSQDSDEEYVLELDPRDGHILWTRFLGRRATRVRNTWGGRALDKGRGVNLARDGSVWVTGQFRFEMVLGPTTLSSKSNFTGYVTRIRPQAIP